MDEPGIPSIDILPRAKRGEVSSSIPGPAQEDGSACWRSRFVYSKISHFDGRTYHGLFVEMKRNNKCKITSKQKEVMEKLELHNYRCEVGYGMDDAMKKIRYYLTK